MLQGALRRSRGQAYQIVPSGTTTGGSNKDAQPWQVGTLCSLCPAHVGRSSWVLPGHPALLPDSAAHKGCMTQLPPSKRCLEVHSAAGSLTACHCLRGPLPLQSEVDQHA